MEPVHEEWEPAPRRRSRAWALPAALTTVLVAVVGVLAVPGQDGRLEVVDARRAPPDRPTTFDLGDAQREPAPALAQGSWRDLAEPPVTWIRPPRLVWTGREVLAWGAVLDGAAGAALDPATGSWSLLPEAPLAPVDGHVAVWAARGAVPDGTGEMIVVGGRPLYGDPRDGPGGAAYDPRARSWRRIVDPPVRVPRGAQATWTGAELVVTGGVADTTPPAAAYDPRADSWRPLPPVPPGTWIDGVTWTGTAVLVVVGRAGRRLAAPVAAWDDRVGRWEPYPSLPPLVASSVTFLQTGRGAVMWFRSADGIGRLLLLDPATGNWAPSAGAPLSDRAAPSLAHTGRHVAVWGGTDVTGPLADAALYDLAEGRWYRVEPLPRLAAMPLQAVWTCGELVVVGYRDRTRRTAGAVAWTPPGGRPCDDVG